MRSYVLTFLTANFIFKVLGRLESIPTGILETRMSLAKCVGEATDRFFEDHEISLVSLSIIEPKNTMRFAIALDRLLFSELFSRSNLSIIIKKTTVPHSSEYYLKKIDNYIIQVRRPMEIKDNLRVLKIHPTWNSHAKFLVVSATIFEDPYVVASGIFKQLWRSKIANGIVLLTNPNNTSLFTVYSWIPFSEKYCTTGFDETRILDKCRFGHFLKGAHWFPRKIHRNLHGCLFRVRAVVWPPYVLGPEKEVIKDKSLIKINDGLEAMLVNTMAEIANFSINYTVADRLQDWGTVYKNGTTTGAFLALKNEESDIAIGSFAATIERNMYFDYIIYNMPESMTWCVPHAEDTDQWKKLLMVIPIRKCLNDTAFDKNAATCTPRLYMKYAVNLYVAEDGTPLLYCFRDSVVTYPLEMLLDILLQKIEKHYNLRVLIIVYDFETTLNPVKLNILYRTSDHVKRF
ncbi:hypothetical protein ILUMI_06237 [Ignelater luminosus]|uniref:Uncharacterized protein n=1 Tax=Ignelater luminosus TaxID=2038154 RepID=A0A8K0D656_IGNLU|nr:hypothetical protein ILUMI_06237 [Ignelater luminosus]